MVVAVVIVAAVVLVAVLVIVLVVAVVEIVNRLVVDCMRAGRKKKSGRLGCSPRAGRGWGGGGAPPICKRTRLSPSKALKKKVLQY